MDDCGGCKTCEIACSYKLTGEFNHQISGIEIVERKDGSGYDIKLLEQPEGNRLACDGCIDREAPFCLDYCLKSTELKEIIKEFVGKCRSNSNGALKSK
jgi:Fe-S-cluster-containing hydrogenase component 2